MTITDVDQILDRLIVGRVSPRIYAFSTNTLPNYLKVGDTYRPVGTRLREWQRDFPDLSKEFEGDATISDDVYFRDYAVHRFLERKLGKSRLLASGLSGEIYYSNEFFENTFPSDVRSAIADIREDYAEKRGTYVFYNANDRLPQPFVHQRKDPWTPRPNQQDIVNNFKSAVKNGRSNLLMYAVMRFGKSFTSLLCAESISAEKILIVSAKADVRGEWKMTVESAGNFEGWHFIDSEALKIDNQILSRIQESNGTAVVFLTLQDLQGDELKEKHRSVFEQKFDLLIVDETHFGVRADEYGRVLREHKLPTDPEVTNDPDRDDEVDPHVVDSEIKQLKAAIKLHLSGTPYRILMGNEFEPEDVISFVQFSDIVRAQEKWDEEHLNADDTNEWDNPYFGFPQMVRFAFNPNESARKKLKELRDGGHSFAMAKLFEPESTRLDRKNGKHRVFRNETEILDLLRVIDGSEEDDNVLSFLNYEKIKDRKMCRHLVVVLPYRASCDALEALIEKHLTEFKNLGSYRIINISGVEGARAFPNPESIKRTIADAEAEDQKTMTLTVNRMLTGSTVREWDTMLFFKDTASPQEYDQAVFRLQNQYTRSLVGSDGQVIKENLKPQTLLVDFSPERMFRMQEQKALIYNANVNAAGNDKLEHRINRELYVSPIVTINAGNINEVQASDILRVISDYNKERSVADEARDIPADLGVLRNEDILRVIRAQQEIGSRRGLEFKPNDGPETDLDTGENTEPQDDGGTKSDAGGGKNRDSGGSADDSRSLEKKLQTYYQRILFFAMLASRPVRSLSEIVESVQTDENKRIARNLGLDVKILEALLDSFDPFKLSALDYKIQNISHLTHDDSLSPTDRASQALSKFNRIADSEIRTPPWLCDFMVDQLPDEQISELVLKGEKIIDIASKSGEFAIALYRRLTVDLKLPHSQVRNAIFSIPTSAIAYEFTRRFYEVLDLNVDNIAEHFTSYDLLELVATDDTGYRKILPVLSQPKSFKSIRLHDQPEEGDAPVRFGAVVGNPPFQEGRQGTSARQIYPYFMDISYALAQIACLVTPARFLFGAGNSDNSWNEAILNDGHIRVAKHWERAAQVFPEVEVKGGVAVTIRDTSKDYGKLGPFSVYPEVKGIISKARAEGGKTLRETVHLQLKFNLADLYKDHPEYASIIGSSGKERRLTTNIFQKLPDLFKEQPEQSTDIKVLGLISLKRTERYIDRKYITESEHLPNWKVVLPKTSGSGIFGEKLTGPELLGPNSGHTQSFVSLGSFETKTEAEALLSYLKTKFARALLSTRKVTQDNNSEVWGSVPLQDFSKSSAIDWGLSINDIDQQLFDFYRLTSAEREFITTRVEPM